MVITGSGRARLEDETIEVGPGDAIRVGLSLTRSFEAGSEGMEMIRIGGRKPEGQDGIRDENFWI